MNNFVNSFNFQRPFFANDLDAFIPEVWAAESLIVLNDSLVITNLVHRDFSSAVAQQGDVVNTRKPSTFVANRKVDGDSVSAQDADATNVPVKLDQWFVTSFVIRDGEESKGFKNLRDLYLIPAIESIAQQMDRIVLGERYNFINHRVGKLGTAPTRPTLISLDETMNTLNIPATNRRLVLSAAAKADLISVDDFIQADKRGDGGKALREAELGRVLGFDTYMSTAVKTITTANTTFIATTSIDNGNITVGTTDITVASASNILAGQWLYIVSTNGNKPHLITAIDSVIVTIWPALDYAITHADAVKVIDNGLIDLTGDSYAIGYNKEMVIKGVSGNAPTDGQLASIEVATPDSGAGGDAFYSIIPSSTPSPTAVLNIFNQSLHAAAADGVVVGYGPAGDYSFAFHKNAIALVTRPLAAPAAGTGALAAVADANGVGIRVVITYDASVQQHRVTVDVLCGVKTLDNSLGCLLLG